MFDVSPAVKRWYQFVRGGGGDLRGSNAQIPAAEKVQNGPGFVVSKAKRVSREIVDAVPDPSRTSSHRSCPECGSLSGHQKTCSRRDK